MFLFSIVQYFFIFAYIYPGFHSATFSQQSDER